MSGTQLFISIIIGILALAWVIVNVADIWRDRK